jgi:hypothetical protein
MKLARQSPIRIAGVTFAIAAVLATPAASETLSPAHHECPHNQGIACGSTTTEELTSTGSCRVDADGSYFDVYSFSGRAGQQVAVTLTGDFDTRLSLCYSIACFVFGGERGDPTSSQIVYTLPYDGTWVILVRAQEPNTFGAYTLTLQCDAVVGTCEPSPTTLCLQNGRFRVRATFWPPQGQTGNAMAVPTTSDAGLFWFFSPNNIEMIVKVVDGCAFNQHHWVFAAGLTNVMVFLTVTDMETGTSRSYVNPQGTAFAPLQDTEAFAICS